MCFERRDALGMLNPDQPCKYGIKGLARLKAKAMIETSN